MTRSLDGAGNAEQPADTEDADAQEHAAEERQRADHPPKSRFVDPLAGAPQSAAGPLTQTQPLRS